MRLCRELLDNARSWCAANPDGCELLLADIFGAYASMDTEINKLPSALDGFQKQADFLEKARVKGQWVRPNVLEVAAVGGLANGYHGLNDYTKAEEYYRRTLELWKDVPGNSNMYETHLGTCLTLQNKLDEAEKVFLRLIDERKKLYGPRDTTTFR